MKSSILITLLTLTFSQLSFAGSSASQDLLQAIKANNMNKFMRALNNGADMNSVVKEESLTSTPFIKAVVLNRFDMIKIMIKRGADINQRRPIDQYTPLMIAAKNNQPQLSNLLLQSGAHVNLVTGFNRTALQIAALHNSLEAAQVLVSSSSIDVNNRGSMCALAIAARQGYTNFVKLLISQKGSKAPNQICYNSAKEMAQKNNHEEISRLLR